MTFVRASRPPRKPPATAKPCPEDLRRNLSKTCSPDWRMGPDSRARNTTQVSAPGGYHWQEAAQRLGPMGGWTEAIGYQRSGGRAAPRCALPLRPSAHRRPGTPKRARKVETMVSRVLGLGLKGSLRKGDKKGDTGSADNHCFEYSHPKKGARESRNVLTPREPPRVKPHDVQLRGRPRNGCGVGQSLSLSYSPPSRS